tara:strand:- start:140 stop:418 length:279 start_codon:yes stop_codon:yes gene_type:complete
MQPNKIDKFLAEVQNYIGQDERLKIYCKVALVKQVLDYFADRPELDADATRGLVCLLDEVEKQVLNFEEFEIISKEFAQYLRENGKEAVGNV